MKEKKKDMKRSDSGARKPGRFAKFAVLVGAVTTLGLVSARCNDNAPGSAKCVPNTAPVECNLTESLTEGVVAPDAPLQMGNLVLRLEGVEESGEGPMAVLAVDDNCGNVLKTDRVSEGDTKTFVIEGAEYEVAANIIHEPLDAEGTPWVDVTVDLKCPTEPVECVPDLTPTDCHSTAPIVQGVTTADEPLQMGNLKLYLEATEESGSLVKGIFRIEDGCGNVLKKDKVAEGETKTFNIEGAYYDVTVNALNTNGTEWSDVTVDLDCPPMEMCFVASGIINTGESILFDNLAVRLDDVNSDPKEAFLSILDDQNNVIQMLGVLEGDSVNVLGYLIRVPVVAPGYTFGAKWAEIEIYGNNCE